MWNRDICWSLLGLESWFNAKNNKKLKHILTNYSFNMSFLLISNFFFFFPWMTTLLINTRRFKDIWSIIYIHVFFYFWFLLTYTLVLEYFLETAFDFVKPNYLLIGIPYHVNKSMISIHWKSVWHIV